MCFLSRSRLQCKHKLFINVGYLESNFSKRTTSGTNNGSKIKLATHRISTHNINVLCQIYIKRQQYFYISGISNSLLSRERILFLGVRRPSWDFKRIFFTIAALPNVIGVIDGTLIPIIAPKDNEADFVCRKGFHAINA